VTWCDIKLKTGNKPELVEQLKWSDGDDDVGNNRSDESYDDLNETVMGNINMRNENKDTIRPMQRGKYVLTFKDIEDAIDKFSSDNGKDVNQWIREFDDLAKLYKWLAVHQTIYAIIGWIDASFRESWGNHGRTLKLR